MTLDELTLHPRTRNLADRYAAALPHGLIIEGPVGTGVLTIASALARSVGSPAFVIQPKKLVKGNWEVDLKEGSVVIEDIRALYLQTRSRIPGNQVYIIDTSEKSMTKGAQNAFLKLLEEPRAGVHFIIATHQSDQLLPTIHSRTQKLPVLPITDTQTGEFIKSLGQTDPTKNARLAFVGRGRPALMQRLNQDDEQYESRVTIMSDAKTMISGDTYDKMVVIQKYRDNRANALTLIDDMNHQLQTVIRKQPDSSIARDIDKHLRTRDRIAAGGNIRLQLASDVL